MLDTFGDRLPETLHFKTQAADEKGTIPEHVGQDGQEIEHAIIEAKFWAGLTPRRPLAYLGRLPTAGGVLIFLAPARRTDTLWNELIQRCRSGGTLDRTAAEFDNRLPSRRVVPERETDRSDAAEAGKEGSFRDRSEHSNVGRGGRFR